MAQADYTPGEAEAGVRLRRGDWLRGQNQAFRAALDGAPLAVSLGLLAEAGTAQLGEGVRYAFYMADPTGTTLHHVVGMSEDYARAVDRFRIGTDSLACGLAVGSAAPVITPDVRVEPRWEPWVWIADEYGYRACWSFPVETASGEFVGTFALYFPEPREARPEDLELTETMTASAAIIIAQHRGREAVGASEARFRALVGAGTDVTDRKGAEAALRESETKYRTLFDSIDTGYCVIEVLFDDAWKASDYRFLETNPSFVGQTGLVDAVGKTVRAMVPGHEEFWFETFGRIVRTGEAERFEHRADALGRWYDVYAFRIGDPANCQVAVLFEDIKERKQAEEQLRESEARLATAFASVPAGVAVIDLAGRVVFANAEYRRFLPTGVMPSQDPDHGHRWQGWDDEGRVLALHDYPGARALRGERVIPGQEMLYTDDSGRAIWTNVATAPTFDHTGRVSSIVSVISNIDERKRSAQALAQSEERQAFLLRLSDELRPLADPMQIKEVATSLLGERLAVNRMFYADAENAHWHVIKGFECDVEPLPDIPFAMSTYGDWIVDMFRAGQRLVVEDMANDPRFEPSERNAHLALQIGAKVALPLVKDGELLAMLVAHDRMPRAWTAHEIALIEETAERTWAAVQRAQVEAALRENETRLSTLFESMGEAFYLVELLRDGDGHVVDVRYLLQNRVAREWSLVPTLGKLLSEINPSFDREWLEIFEQVSTTRQPQRFERFSQISRRWHDYQVFPAGRHPDQVGILYPDVTDRKRAADALRESEERLRLIVENARDYAIFTTDLEARVTDWREGAEAVFGYSRDEMVGHIADILYTPEDNAAGEPEKERALAAATGKAPNVRWHVCKNGDRVFIEGVVTALHDGEGRLTGFLKVGRDATERHAAEERQKMLLGELQHRVRNILTVIRSVFSRTAEAGGSAEDMAEHFRGRLDALARTQVVVTQNPRGAVDLENLIREELLSVGMGDGPQLSLAGPDVELSGEAAEALGLVIHELTTNSLKYGAFRFPNSSLAIRWSVNVDYGGTSRLAFSWEEQGVPAMSVEPGREGFGTELITRALPYRLGAETSFELRPGGLRCLIDLPLPGTARPRGAN